ncbi:relaxase/mobilization nuclease domain-containing protein [Ruminococcus sp.]|uniref:relaxase/mobilization nuclease domain-containing protein n=1 Tax=Ruminococcus sp. TaxID=41978 RepID=UPI0038683AE2
MAVVKFVNAGSPMNNILAYVTRREATESKLISGVNCSPESALDEFRFVKKRFHKEDGRSYYHIVQSFSPDDDLTPETAHEIGLKFAEYFPGFQVLVATHTNTHAVHNHLIMNSVNFENGKKFHQSRDEMLQAKEYSNQLCREYGLSVTEVKTKNPRHAKWKRDLLQVAENALGHSATKEEFIEYMRYHGYDVQWEDKYKYITFTSPEGWKVRDNKLFDERFLKDNLEIYFALGGCDSAIIDPYFDYVTPNHPDCYTMTYSDGLINLLGDILSTVPEDFYYQPHYINELNTAEKLRLEKILGRRICNEAFYTYCTREDYEREQGISM